MSSAEERRCSRRMKLNVPLRIDTEAGIINNETMVKNCSVNGVCFVRPIDGTSWRSREVFLTFALGDNKPPVRVLAWVVHEKTVAGQVEAGATFMFLQPEKEREIGLFIDGCVHS